MRQCSSTKRGLTRRTGRRSQVTHAVGTSTLASTRKSCRSAPRAWLRAGTASSTRRTRARIRRGRSSGFLRKEQDERLRVGERALDAAGRQVEPPGTASEDGERGGRGQPRAGLAAGVVLQEDADAVRDAGLPQRVLEVALQGLGPTTTRRPRAAAPLRPPRASPTPRAIRRGPVVRAGLRAAARAARRARRAVAGRGARRARPSPSRSKARTCCGEDCPGDASGSASGPREGLGEDRCSFGRDSGWTGPEESAGRRIPRRPSQPSSSG